MRLHEVPLGEVEFHGSSFCDGSGRLFWWRGGLYRGVSSPRTALYRRLFDDGVIQALVGRGLLVGTRLTDLTLPGYDLVLEHDRVPCVSYPFEWCAEMLRDAALVVADLEIELAGLGLTLLDANPWNVLFDGTNPVYVDFCSIVPADEYRHVLWEGYDEFRRFFVNPLALMGRGGGHVARWLLHDYDQGVLPSDYEALVTGSWVRARERVARTVRRAVRRRAPRRWHAALGAVRAAGPGAVSRDDAARRGFVTRIRGEVVAIPPPAVREERRYAGDDARDFTLDPAVETVRHERVRALLEELRPESVLDVGAGDGRYARLAATGGRRVVALDIDDRAMARCYRECREAGLRVVPLVMDVRYPSPGLGLGNVEWPPATVRLASDLVLALGLLHVLVFARSLTLEKAVDALGALSTRWLLVEFVSREDGAVRVPETDERCASYRLEALVSALGRQFRRVDVIGPTSPRGSALVLCDRRPEPNTTC